MTKYLIKLENDIIGYTYFERADAPMGVVLGNVYFYNIESGYAFLLEYCLNNNIGINANEPDMRYIDTQAIGKIPIFNENGHEIKGAGICIRGFDEEGFEIDLYGIPYPFYQEEFPHHVEDYRKFYD
jgi:hypothetical protein